MKKLWLVVVSLALMLAVLGVSGCSTDVPTISGGQASLKVSLNSQQEGIWVNWTGKVSVVPDIATLRLGIEAQEESVAVAQAGAYQAMGRVMETLEDNGIDKKDIQTQYFNIHRVTRWDSDKQQEIVIGYRVTNIVTAKIRDMDKIGSIIDAVAVAGGDLTRIDNVAFSVEDPAEYQQEAREKAISDAGEKAEQMARLAGVKLGKPTYITESTYYPSPVYRQEFAQASMAAPAVETSISPGELEISLTVQIAYEILD